MTTTIRQMIAEEYSLLEEFLYQAIFVPQGLPVPDRSIIQLPELQLYVKDFGKSLHDQAMVAERDGQIVGTAWCRIMDDYGHIDEKTPSLAISLLPAYRGQGIGTELLKTFLEHLRKKGYHKGFFYLSKRKMMLLTCIKRLVFRPLLKMRQILSWFVIYRHTDRGNRLFFLSGIILCLVDSTFSE